MFFMDKEICRLRSKGVNLIDVDVLETPLLRAGLRPVFGIIQAK